MLMIVVCFLVSLSVTLAYNAYVLRLFGVTWSVSETYLKLEERKKGSGWLFTAWTFFAGLPLMIAWIDISEGLWFQFLAFFACAGLMFVGAAPRFTESLTKQVHYGGTAVAATAAVLWLVFAGMWWIPAALVGIAVGVALKYKKWMYWLEQAVKISVYAGVGAWIVKTLFLVES